LRLTQIGAFVSFFKFDELEKNLLGRNPSESRIMSGAGAGVQNNLKKLDSGFRRNDRKKKNQSLYEPIKSVLFKLMNTN
jgi:hypothetical protein